MRLILLLYLLLVTFPCFLNSMVLPGVHMTTYNQGDPIPLFVNSYTSTETLLPIDYYKLPMCKPFKLEYQSENLGEYLTGNRIENSPFQLQFLQNKKCEILCNKNYKIDEIKKFDSMVKDNYNIHWIIDNLPVAREDEIGNHELGFPLGTYYEDLHKVSELHNHFRIHIGYNVPSNSPNTTGRIVDFVVYPYSADYVHSNAYKNGKIEYCEPHEGNGFIKPLYLSTSNQQSLEVVWTYSVEWEEMKDREWRTRWDVYFELGNGNNEIHWFSILNALLVVLFLSGMVGMILLRNLHRDITRYNRVPTEEERYEEKEETGWKLIHSDVFRSPTKHPMFFCILVGTGYQILGMAFATLLFACFGLLSPSHRGNLIIACLVCFILSGFVAGYFSAQNYKLFKGKNWQSCTILTSLLFPGFVFSVFFLLNLFVWGAGSNAAVPFGSMIVVIVLWFGISVPLVFLGSYYGYKRPTIQFPVATSNIPRPIPPQPWYMSHAATCLIGGILPFGAIFVELFFILTSLWTNKYYYVFGFLLLAISILLGTCAEITIVLCYFQLCAEDYHWWWRSFFVSGACGFYVFLYSTYYFITRLDVSNVIGAMLYFGYMLIISIAIFIMCGMIGHKACLWFTTKIYASIKVD